MNRISNKEKDREKITFWVARRIKEEFLAAAKKEGVSLTDWMIISGNERLKGK